MEELLDAVEPGTVMRLELVGGGAVEGPYASHDDCSITIQLGGYVQEWDFDEIETPLISIVSRVHTLA
jgi:hypothetical protein